MAKRQHVKTKDKDKQQTLALIAASSERKEMPRPVVFRDKSKYDRNRYRRELRMAY